MAGWSENLRCKHSRLHASRLPWRQGTIVKWLPLVYSDVGTETTLSLTFKHSPSVFMSVKDIKLQFPLSKQPRENPRQTERQSRERASGVY